MTTFTTQDRQDAERELVNRTPLTNEQIEKLYFSIFEPTPGIGLNLTNGQYEFARAIERAHGIGE